MPQLGTSSSSRKFRPYRLLTEQEAISDRRRKRALKTLVMAVLLLAAASYAYIYYNSFFERTSEANVVTQSSQLKSKVSGKVTKILVKETQSVKAGDALVQLDQREFQAELDRRQGELDRTEDRLKGGWVYLERLQKAAADGGDSEKEKYDGARKWYYKLQAKTQEMREGVAQAKAQLSATTITAPAEGHVAKRMVAVGATVTEGQPLVELVGAVQPWLIANFKETQLAQMQVGQKAVVSVAGLEHAFFGRVESMPPKPQTVATPTKFEKLVSLFSKTEPRLPVKIAVDPKSIKNEVNRLSNGAPADVKVYIK